MIIIILSAAAITESCRENRWGRGLQNTVTDWSHAQKATSSFLVGAGRRKRTLASNHLYNLIFKTPEKCWDLLLPSLADISIVCHSKVSLIPWWPSDSSLHFLHQFSSRKTSESEQQPHTAAQIAIVSLLLLLRSRKKIMHIPTEPILNSSYTRFLSNSCSKSLKSIQDRCNRVTRGSFAAVTRAWDG